MAWFRVELLGGLRVHINDKVITRFRTRKTASLLAYLAYHLDRMHHRELLAEMFWGDSKPEQARNSLSKAISSLRHQLTLSEIVPESPIYADRFYVGLRPELVTTDVAEFETFLKKAQLSRTEVERVFWLEKALQVYKGELLPDFYDDWIEIERRLLSEKFEFAVRLLVGLHERAGNLTQALSCARRALEAEPFSEVVCEQVMRLLLMLSQPEKALREFQSLRQRLKNRLGHDAVIFSHNLKALATEAERRLSQNPFQSSNLTVSERTDNSASVSSTLRTVTLLAISCYHHSNGKGLMSPLKDLIEQHGGQVAKIKGNVLLCSFPSAQQALNCAVACCGRSQSLSVRCFVDTMDLASDSDLILILEQMRELIDNAVANGQVACSEVTAALVKRNGELPLNLKKLRRHSNSKLVTLFFVNYVPIKNEEARTNLPPLTNRFFGRSEELRQLKQFFLKERAQLVTLVGFGGCGKTRLALEFGSQVLEDYKGAVRFVSLQNLKAQEKIGEAMAKALGLKIAPDKEPLEIALQVLAGQRCLLILDNFEQLMPEGAETLQKVMAQLPKAQFLVTSRCPLGLPQERVMPLQPLPFPKGLSFEIEANPLETLNQFPSVQMFVDRAKLVQPDFQLTERTVSKVSKICELLEGIPLSIELAASSLSYMSLSQILKRLSNRLEFLKSRQRNIPAKHRTMKEVLRATYELLPPELKYALACMSVFRGGATTDALQAVSGTNDISDVISQLRSFGLVQAVNSKGSEQRFVLLETLREFVDEITDTEVKSDLRLRHAMFFLSLSERFSNSEGRNSDEWAKWLDRMEFERNNLRAALEWAIGNEPQVALRIMDSLTMFWVLKGSFREARQWTQRILNHIPKDQLELRGKVLTLAGYWSIRVGDYKLARKLCELALPLYEQISNRSGQGKVHSLLAQIAFLEGNYNVSRKHLEAGLSIYQSENDIKGQADVYLNLGTIAFRQGDLQSSQRYYEKCLQLFEAVGDRLNAENAKVSLANIAWRQGDYEKARTLYEEAIKFWEKVAPEKVAGILTDWGLIALSKGDYEQAKRHYEAALEIRREMGDLVGVGAALNGLASVAWREGRFEDAQKLLVEALKIFRTLRNQWCVALTLTDLGNLSLLKGDPQNACKLLSQSLRLWLNLGDRWGIANALRKLASALTCCGDLQNAIMKLCESIALCEIIGDKLGIAEAMEALAEALYQMGESILAVQFLSAAATLRDQIGASLPKTRAEPLSTLLTTLRKNLREVRFENAWQQGKAVNFHYLLRHLTCRHLLDSNLSISKQPLKPQLKVAVSTS